MMRSTLAIAALALSACAASRIEQTPAEEKLHDNIAAVHAAIGRGDVEKWYAMTPPSVRNQMSLADFKRDIRWDSVGARRPPQEWKAEVAKLCSCRQETTFRCVVSVHLRITDAEKAPVEEWPLETWDHVGGNWYLAYIGANTGGRCPGQ